LGKIALEGEGEVCGMKILLINPWIYDFAAYDEWMKPLGLLYIASFLEKFGMSG